MSIILANFGKYAISDCPFSFFVDVSNQATHTAKEISYLLA